MSHARPEAACREMAFDSACALEEAAEVALEDYARVLTRSSAAEALRDVGSGVRGVHLCRPAAEITPALRRDLEDFARGLATGTAGGGLGWT